MKRAHNLNPACRFTRRRRAGRLNLRTPVLLFILVLASLAARAQVYPEAYLEQAVQTNPGLQAQQKAYEAALQQVDAVSSLPDPQLTAGFFLKPMERFMGKQWFDVGVMQMFPWFGTLGSQKMAVREMAQADFHKYRQERNSLFMEMTRLWLEIFKLDQQGKILLQYIDVLKAREDLIYSRYAGGMQRAGQALDIYRLEIQLSDLQNQLEKINEENRALVQSFNILAGRAETAEVITPDRLPDTSVYDFQGRPDAAFFAANPRLNMAQSAAEAAGLQQQLSRLHIMPMLGVGLQYSYLSPGEAAMGQMDGGHMIMPMVSLSLPIFRNKNRAIRQQGVLMAEEAVFMQDNRLNELQMQWTRLEAELLNLQRDVRFYDRQKELTLKAWDLVLTGYSAGEESFDELLRIQDQLLDLEWRLLEVHILQNLKLAEMDLLQAKNIFE
jgi:outer membrane protein TolC